MPPIAIAAGIGAVGSIAGGAIASSGAKKAAQTQQDSVNAQIAANNANRAQITGMEQPTIDRGNAAGDQYAGLLGLGGASNDAGHALNVWRDSAGYQDLLKTGLGAVNANAYARGMGDSGATLKALQQKGMGLADQTQQQYLGNLNTLIQTGNSAIGNIAGVNTATTQANNQALQTGADASANASLVSSNGWQNTLKNLTNIGANYASSYGSGGGTGGFNIAPNVNAALSALPQYRYSL